MQQPASESQSQPRKTTALVAGLGAALVAGAITLVTMTSNPSPTAPDQAASQPQTQCATMKREVLVSTVSGSGTVRLREGSYLSPPITLSTTPQRVTFPLDRPPVAGGEEVITIEGNATDVVLTSPLTTWRRVFDKVTGVVAFSTQWAPGKGC